MQKKSLAFHWIWKDRLGICTMYISAGTSMCHLQYILKTIFFCTWKYCTFYNFKQIQKCLENIRKLMNYLTEKNVFKTIFPHRGIIGFDNSVWDFWWRHNGKSIHYSVWVLFTNFWNEQSSHPASGSAAQRMSQLKTFDYTIYVLGQKAFSACFFLWWTSLNLFWGRLGREKKMYTLPRLEEIKCTRDKKVATAGLL